MTAKERQIWFWQKEVEARFNAWKESQQHRDFDKAFEAKRKYIEAEQTLQELEGD